jgi:hypothetical protein
MMGSDWPVAPRHDRERVDVACIPACTGGGRWVSGCATETALAGARAVDGWATKKAVWTQLCHGLEQGGLGRTDGYVVVVGRCSDFRTRNWLGGGFL